VTTLSPNVVNQYRVAHFTGGSMFCFAQLMPAMFIEELSGIPFAWGYDSLTAESGSSPHVVSLACPKHRGSLEPRFSVREYAYDIYLPTVLKVFQPRDHYFVRGKIYEDIVNGLEATRSLALSKSESFDSWISRIISQPLKITSRFMNAARDAINAVCVQFNRSAVFESVNHPPPEITIKPLAYIFNHSFEGILSHHLDAGRKRIRNHFYSPAPIHSMLDDNLVFEDGKPVMLGDVITGIHIESFNISKMETAYHSVIKASEFWVGYVSDPELPLAEPSKCSIAAPTVFQPYQSPYTGCSYEDIADVNTVADSMNFIRRKLPAETKRQGISFGAGIEKIEIDVEVLKESFITGRLDPKKGAALRNTRIVHKNVKARRDLEEELGIENIHFINKFYDPLPINNELRIRAQLREFGQDFPEALIRANIEEEASRLPCFDLLDGSPQQMDKIEDFGWSMVWDNLPVLIHEAREGLKRAYNKGLIDADFLQERMEYINEVFPGFAEHSIEKFKAEKRQGLWSYLARGGSLPRLGGRLSFSNFFGRRLPDGAVLQTLDF